jgi:hypothetical protein
MITNRALAPTTFIAGPEEDLAAPDVYEIKSDAVINKLPLPASVSVETLTAELRGGKSPLNLPGIPLINPLTTSQVNALDGITIDGYTQKQINAMGGVLPGNKSLGFLDTVKSFGTTMNKAVGGVAGIRALSKMDTPSLLSRLASGTLSGVPGLGNTGLASLTSSLASSAIPTELKRFLNTPVPNNLGTFSTIGGTVTRLVPSKINQSYQMSSLINNVMNSPSTNIVDKDGTARLMAGLSMGGMSSGMNNSFSSVLPMAGGDRQVEVAAAMAALKYTGNTGNASGMKDVLNAIGPSNLRSISDSVVKSFSTNYNPSELRMMTPEDRKTDFQEITHTFDQANPSWLSTDRMKIDLETQQPVVDFRVTNLALVSEGSVDFKKTMVSGAISSNDPELKYLAAAGMFPVTSPEEELRKNFPLTFTSITSNTTANNTFTPEQVKAMDGIMIDGFTRAQLTAMNGITVE